jgi:low affinity Fe/Cu permease
MTFEKGFAQVAAKISRLAGTSSAFCAAVAAILVWGVSGPFFRFSPAWQLVVNTGTTIITFLMVFVIQNSQNRDGLALQIKLDEIIRAIGQAQNVYLDLENRSQEELDQIKAKFEALAEKARARELKVKSIEAEEISTGEINVKT